MAADPLEDILDFEPASPPRFKIPKIPEPLIKKSWCVWDELAKNLDKETVRKTNKAKRNQIVYDMDCFDDNDLDKTFDNDDNDGTAVGNQSELALVSWSAHVPPWAVKAYEEKNELKKWENGENIGRESRLMEEGEGKQSRKGWSMRWRSTG